MPFFLYRRDGTDYVRDKSYVPLAGLSGPLCAAARRAPNEPEWDLSEQELLCSYIDDPENYAFIIDLKPGIETISLYRLKHVWGYSANGWTPLALELESLYSDLPTPTGVSANEFKARFPAGTASGDRIYEFLYLNGDGYTGSWSFGSVGSVNAPLLWESVFDSFIKRINRKRRASGLGPIGDFVNTSGSTQPASGAAESSRSSARGNQMSASTPFIQIGDKFINVNSISYVERNDIGNTVIFLQALDNNSRPRTVVITPPDADAVLEFFKQFTAAEF